MPSRPLPTARNNRRTLARYLLFQLPSWVIAAACLALAQIQGWLAAPWPLLLFLGLVAKDLLIYPWMRIAYEPSDLHGPEALTGQIAIVEARLDPEGHVRIGAERWRARSVGASLEIASGSRVRVERVEGLLLWVEPLDAGVDRGA